MAKGYRTKKSRKKLTKSWVENEAVPDHLVPLGRRETYLNTLSQILGRWSIKEAEDFEAKVDSLIEKLKTQKYLCPASSKQSNLRRCVIAPQTSLVYQIKNDVIELVAFFDNRSDHQY